MRVLIKVPKQYLKIPPLQKYICLCLGIDKNCYLLKIRDVANSKRFQRLDKTFIFLPALHQGNQQNCFQKNSVMQYAHKTWRNPVRTAYACCNADVSYSIRLLTKCTCSWQSFLANNFADFQYSAGKNQDFVQSLVAFGINNICYCGSAGFMAGSTQIFWCAHTWTCFKIALSQILALLQENTPQGFCTVSYQIWALELATLKKKKKQQKQKQYPFFLKINVFRLLTAKCMLLVLLQKRPPFHMFSCLRMCTPIYRSGPLGYIVRLERVYIL